MDQRDIVEQAQRGDHDAFAHLARAAVARLDAAARLILRDPDLAHDAVQEGLLRGWRDLRGLRDPDRFDAWLRQLVVHACIDILRRRRHRAIEVELTPIDDPAVGDFASAVVDRDALDAALRRLDPENRAIVVMHYFLGMPMPEIARTVGVPLGTCKSRLHRSIEGMRLTIGTDERTDVSPIPRGRLA